MDWDKNHFPIHNQIFYAHNFAKRLQEHNDLAQIYLDEAGRHMKEARIFLEVKYTQIF